MVLNWSWIYQVLAQSELHMYTILTIVEALYNIVLAFVINEGRLISHCMLSAFLSWDQSWRTSIICCEISSTGTIKSYMETEYSMVDKLDLIGI